MTTAAQYKQRRVVVTGIGAVTPIGLSAKEFWANAIAGKSGAAKIASFDASDYDTKIACEVKGFNPLDFMDKKTSNRMDLFTQYAMACAEMAVKDSCLNLEKEDRERIGVIFGSGIGGMWTWHRQMQTVYQTGGPHRISPFFVPMMIADIAAGCISMRFQVKGPNYATTSACATSSHAIADAFMLIQRNDADVIFTGGSEAAVCPMGVGGFNAMKALSTRNDEPEKASRPFDAQRDGFVIGEGAGILILEELDHALTRGARIYAELSGIGLTADAYHITAPAPGGEGAIRSMRLCMKDAGVKPEEVDYINAHGTSTPFNDKSETQAIKAVFGEHAYRLGISSTKSMTGHLLGAAGAIEAIVAVLSTYDNIMPPTINYEFPDPDCDLNYLPNKAVKKTVRVAISNTFGFGGHNASLLFKGFQRN
ncbi:MAG: beta-ketoacyl-[acyl-carrier-protein] synthase II [Ignavibacteria bacterium 13_1_40CM_2_61_4]|nr:MAG: beta-ketoacyl-[acyl-carrier-protein] synthase II [Ignavibacteria bacterium 13_1_40CM_2_61_4]